MNGGSPSGILHYDWDGHDELSSTSSLYHLQRISIVESLLSMLLVERNLYNEYRDCEGKEPMVVRNVRTFPGCQKVVESS
jgi:hypothetical protein